MSFSESDDDFDDFRPKSKLSLRKKNSTKPTQIKEVVPKVATSTPVDDEIQVVKKKSKKRISKVISDDDSDSDECFEPISKRSSKKPRLSVEDKVFQRELQEALKASAKEALENKSETEDKEIKVTLERNRKSDTKKKCPVVVLTRDFEETSSTPNTTPEILQVSPVRPEPKVPKVTSPKPDKTKQKLDVTSPKENIVPKNLQTSSHSTPGRTVVNKWSAPRFVKSQMTTNESKDSREERSPSMVPRVGLSRNMKVHKPLHPNVKLNVLGP